MMNNEMNEPQGQERMEGLAGQGQQGMGLIKQVVELLMQGMTPDELIQKGVPPEVIKAAIEFIKQQQGQMPQAQGQAPQGPVGLAQMSVQGPA